MIRGLIRNRTRHRKAKHIITISLYGQVCSLSDIVPACDRLTNANGMLFSSAADQLCPVFHLALSWGFTIGPVTVCEARQNSRLFFSWEWKAHSCLHVFGHSQPFQTEPQTQCPASSDIAVSVNWRDSTPTFSLPHLCHGWSWSVGGVGSCGFWFLRILL